MKTLFLVLTLVFSTSAAVAKTPNEKKIRYPTNAIIQSVIDHERLQPYLHPEIANRVPLVLSDRLIGRNLVLTKFNQNVRIVPDRNVTGAYLRFTKFDCKFGTYCNIAFEYPVEGVIGTTGVAINPDGSHRLEKTDIHEQ